MSQERCRSAIVLATALLLGMAGCLRAGGITLENFKFVQYPGFPDALVAYGSLGYSKTHHKVFVGVNDHRSRIGFYEYDPAVAKIRLLGFVHEMIHLRDYQWQAKIHSKLIEGPDHDIYFVTHGGESRQEYLMNHPRGYQGGWLCKWSPAEERMTALGKGLKHDSFMDLTMDRTSGLIMAVSYPQVHLLLFDPPKYHACRDLGKVGGDYVPRILWSDWFGNMYYVDWRMRIIKYEKQSGKLLFARNAHPAFGKDPGHVRMSGVTAYAEDRKRGAIYLITYGGKMLALKPKRSGIGPVEVLGRIWEGKSGHTPNLALADNGLLYYIIDGGYLPKVDGRKMSALMEFDPKAKKKRIALRFPLEQLRAVTGCDVKDKDGNIYLCGRRRDAKAKSVDEYGATVPVLTIFNPERKLR